MDDIGSLVAQLWTLFADHAWAGIAGVLCMVFVTLLTDRAKFFPTWDSPWRPFLGTLIGAAGLTLNLVQKGGTETTSAIISIAATTWPTLAAELAIIRKGNGGPAANALPLLIILPALLAFGPSSCTKDGKTPIRWPDAVQCAGDPLEIVGDVADVLINDYGGKDLSVVGRQKLEDLATKKGEGAVLCIVDKLVREWIAPASAPNPTRIAGAQRGESFLRAIGTKVQRL